MEPAGQVVDPVGGEAGEDEVGAFRAEWELFFVGNGTESGELKGN